MNVYLDTSALVKLYVSEPGTPEVRTLVAGASLVVTSSVAYAEARAAFARRHREGWMDAGDLRRTVRALDDDWERYVVLEASGRLAHQAGDLAESHALRGFDAIHLATAIEFGRLVGEQPTFSTHDKRLSLAAHAEGLPTDPV